jgi:hypothetical protein
MQNSIKGLLCSILYQVLSRKTAMLDTVLISLELQSKDSDTDWSAKELRSLTQKVLSIYPSSLCIFIDGLDEMCEEDEMMSLIKMVEDLRNIPNVKFALRVDSNLVFKNVYATTNNSDSRI